MFERQVRRGRNGILMGLLIAGFSGMAAAAQPNIIFYMVDDLGWNHIGVPQVTLNTAKSFCHTPHLAKLAENGLSFTHAYAQPNCAPTRAAMLSGQYPARVNNQVYVVGHLNRNGRGGITKEKARFSGPEQSEDVAAAAITLAEALKQNGYATAHIGKFHCGGHSGPETLPENVGFDINIGGFSQGHQPTCFASRKDGTWAFKKVGRGDFDRFAAPYDKAYVKRHGLPESLVGTPKHVSDALGDALEETIAKFAAGDRPFYIQFHTYAVHGPVRARPDLKAAAAARMEEAGQQKKLVEYAGFISSVDENLKRLLDAVDDPNGDGDNSDSMTANTLVLFTSDNGGTHTDNAPLRGVKGMLTEGGIRVPLIAHWPGTVPAGLRTSRMVHSIDYYPTFLDLAGRRWRPDAKEHPLDGQSFADILKSPNGRQRNREPLFFLFPGYMDTRAEPTAVVIEQIQDRRYKLYYFYETNSWELYCLDTDIAEEKNLVSTMPEIATALSRKIDAWLRQEHPTWKPAFPISKKTGKSAGPPPLL